MGLINDSPEHKAIRDSVAGIAKRYGPEYFLERARAGPPRHTCGTLPSKPSRRSSGG